MNLIRSDLSPYRRTHIHLSQPESQPDATGFSIAESAALQSGPSIFTEDFVAEHSFSRAAIEQASRGIARIA